MSKPCFAVRRPGRCCDWLSVRASVCSLPPIEVIVNEYSDAVYGVVKPGLGASIDLFESNMFHWHGKSGRRASLACGICFDGPCKFIAVASFIAIARLVLSRPPRDHPALHR